MGVREIDRSLEQWQMGVKDLRRRMILAPTPRERERWYALWLLTQGWTAAATAEALERDPHTIGRWASAFGEGGPAALMFEQTGGSPRPGPGAAGGVERGGAATASHVGNGIGQLVLEGGLREGRANTARGAGHFLRETVGRVRYAGATGQLTMRADSGFYTHAVVAACRKLKVRFSITVRLHQNLRRGIEAIPEADWRPIPYWTEGAADMAETVYTPFRSEPGAAPVRLIVRRVRPTPGSQLALFATCSYHGFITGRDGETPWNWRPTIAATPRSRTPSGTSSTASG